MTGAKVISLLHSESPRFSPKREANSGSISSIVSSSTPKMTAGNQESFDVLVVGAGPTGMACAIEAKRVGLRAVVVDKGCLVNSLFHYPANMTFFTTPELLEIGDIPFSSPNQ